jgi:hypothetical protein
MKKKIGVAGLVAILALGAIAPAAFAQCGGGILIKFDSDVWAYESDAALDFEGSTVGAYKSNTGSVMSVIGIITLFCGTLSGYDANPVTNPGTEYTMYWTGLTANAPGTVETLYPNTSTGPGRKYTTDYSGGTFQIYEGSPRNAATQANIGSNPQPGSVANFIDGTLFLSGTFSTLTTVVTRLNVTNTATFGGSFNGGYSFNTGGGSGSASALVAGYGPGTLGTGWCGKYPNTAPGGCVPDNYTAHPNGKFDIPVVTDVHSSTWGAIKQLYR